MLVFLIILLFYLIILPGNEPNDIISNINPDIKQKQKPVILYSHVNFGNKDSFFSLNDNKLFILFINIYYQIYKK